MKIAIFHNYFDVLGGGEKLTVAMARVLGADIITTDINPEVVRALGARDVRFRSVGKTMKMPGFKQVSASLYFARADVSREYDFFIMSGEWAVFAAKKHRPNLYYCHTPVRVFYDLYAGFLRRQSLVKKPLFWGWVRLHKYLLEHALASVNQVVCNSRTTKARIRRFWKRGAKVIYPFSVFKGKSAGACRDFWLSVNRLYPEKRIELQVEALRLLPREKLVIVGGFARGDHAERYYQNIIQGLPQNVQMISDISEEQLAGLYRGCKGLLVTAQDEDFGMNVLEAFSFGKPVVAVNEGGYCETMVNGKTGFLVLPTVHAIVEAMRLVQARPLKYRRACLRRARKFSRQHFFRALRKALKA